jgi:hypothetical protein
MNSCSFGTFLFLDYIHNSCRVVSTSKTTPGRRVRDIVTAIK